MSTSYPTKKQCLICGNNLLSQNDSFFLFSSHDCLICGSCMKKFVPSKKKNVLYEYNAFFRKLLFTYKGLGDLALHPVFLIPRLDKLKRKYGDYMIVVVPSLERENQKRGFAVLPWICKSITPTIISPFYKNKDYKQATSKDRKEILNVIKLKYIPDIKGKKVLLVDDVMTSGYTIEACKRLLLPLEPLKLEVLVLASKKKGSYERKSRSIL